VHIDDDFETTASDDEQARRPRPLLLYRSGSLARLLGSHPTAVSDENRK
jgi:hypothetical protein